MAIAGLLPLALILNLNPQLALATPAEPERAWRTTPERSTPVKGIRPTAPTPDATAARAISGSVAVTWPGAAAATVDLVPSAAAADATDLRSLRVRAGSLPVTVSPAMTPPPISRSTAPDLAPDAADLLPGRIRVETLDQAAAYRSGYQGLLLRVGRADGVKRAAALTVEIDYSGFRHAYGGDWAARLHLVQLPECALSTPDRAECQGTTLPTRNDTVGGRLSAPVTASAGSGGTLLAAVAAAAGTAGSFAATSLSPSASWNAGGPLGDFTWSYPMRVPPAPGGHDPDLGLSYASSGVDGRTVATNNQPSWVGEGFELWPGFIERRYKACADDRGTGANNPGVTGDMCWATDNASMSLAGSGGELIRDDATGAWRLKSDDGTRIERLSGAANGDEGDNPGGSGEYWKVTTPAGTQYFFGLNRLPGWIGGKPETNSTFTMPVYGNQSGEPCYKASYDAAWCQQAWRWNLDYVVDRHGDVISYTYAKETNKYGRNNDPAKATDYVRGGYLVQSDYGQRDGAAYGTGVGKVLFTAADRCVPGTACTRSDPKHWPDTPWDQDCAAAPCTNRTVASFWTSKRLASITTQVWDAAKGSFRDVDSWTLRHTYPDPADGTRAGLWLAGITHTGLVDGSLALPEVTFSGQQLANRVDGVDGIAPMNWWRIRGIRSESGGELAVTYAPVDCTPGSLPASPDSNTKRCMPVRWTPPNQPERLDWFQKYVVSEVTESDLTSGLQPVVHRYEYLGAAAWRYAEDDGLTPEKYRTWSQWRGYQRVRVRTGHEADGPQKLVETLYLRGMNGDRTASGGTRSVTVTASEGGPIADDDPYTGFAREVITYLGSTDQVLSRTLNEPWLSAPTATRVKPWGTSYARTHNTVAIDGRMYLDGGAVRRTRLRNTYTTVDGRPGVLAAVDDRGDLDDPADDKCVRYTYASNRNRWLLDAITRVTTYSVSCDVANPAPADVTTDARTYYDGNASLGALDAGNPTRMEKLVGWTGTTPVYQDTNRTVFDLHGRAIESYDLSGMKTTTAYTPATGGPVTRALTTNALGHTITSDIDPAWGQVRATIDANGKKAEAQYDPLGRVVKVWQPGHVRGTDPHDVEYEYLHRIDGPNVVTTKTLKHDGTYLTSYTLYDGLLRPRQTQDPAPGGGRVVTDVIFNSRGEATKRNGPYYNDGAPGFDILLPDEAQLPAQTMTTYDSAGRPVAEIFKIQGTEQWRTTTAYHGDRVDVTPPGGATATSTHTNARGQVVELRQYQGATPTGGYDATRYTYTKLGEIASVTDPAGNQWRYFYNVRGQKIREEDPDRGTTVFAYDDGSDELLSTTDARGRTVAYSYDAIGRRTGAFDGSLTGPKLAEWTFDTVAKGHPASSTRYLGGNAYTSRVTGYDDAYRATGTDVVIPSAVTGLAGTYHHAATYHVDGSPATATLPAAGGLPAETLTYGYDSAFSLPTTLSSNLGSYVTGSTYTPFAEPWQTTTSIDASGATGWVRTTYEYHVGTRRLGRSLVERDGSPMRLSNAVYSYDPAGNVTKVADQATGVATDTQCFRYDQLRRLTAAWTPASGNCAAAPTAAGLGGPAPYYLSWAFDKTGNRTSQTTYAATGNTTATSTYPAGAAQPHTLRSVSTAGPGGTRLDEYGYDQVGNTTSRKLNGTTQSLEWDAEGHLAKVTEGSKVTSYVYDADGNRLLRTDPGGTTLYLGTDEIKRAVGGAVTATRYYTHQGRTIAVRVNGTGADSLHWLAGDHHGTANLAVKASDLSVQRRYSLPFGDSRGTPPTAWPGEQGFVGGTVDASTGLTHLGAREYEPGTGRFISLDPVVDFSDPQQLNGYAYANNTPLTLADPDGRYAGSDPSYWAAYGAYVAALATAPAPAAGNNPPGNGGGGSSGSGNGNGGSKKPPKCDLKCKIGGGLKKAGNWVKEHKTTIIAVAAGVAAGVACGIVTAGAAAVACGVAAGALIGAAEYHFTTPASERSLGGYFKAAAVGAVTGVIGAGIGKLAGVAIKAGAQALGQGAKAVAQAAGKAAVNEAKAMARSAANAVRNTAAGGSRGGSSAAGGGAGRSAAGGGRGGGGGGAGKPASQGGGCNSFTPATPVLLADGTTKPIQDVQIGDQVLASDPTTGETAAKPVTATIIGEGDKKLIRITVDDGSGPATITATDGHPFWVDNGKGWLRADGLAPGDTLLTPDGSRVRVLAVVAYGALARVHNLTVADLHTYYVRAGAQDVLVHNANFTCPVHPQGGGRGGPGCRCPRSNGSDELAGEDALAPTELQDERKWVTESRTAGAQGLSNMVKGIKGGAPTDPIGPWLLIALVVVKKGLDWGRKIFGR